jgi:CheY-like chemotaxis protein
VTEAAAAARVLVVTHEEDGRVLLRRALRNAGYEVEVASDAVHALEASRTAVVLALVDLALPRRDGWALLAHFRGLAEAPAVVALVARADQRAFAQAIREGAAGYVFQPFAPDDVVALCQTVLARPRARPATEERRHPRRLVASPVTVYSPDGAVVGTGDLVNLGAGGAQVHLPLRLEPRTQVRLSLPVAVGDALACDAVVQWSSRAAAGFAHGLAFAGVTLALRRQLADLLEPPSA